MTWHTEGLCIRCRSECEARWECLQYREPGQFDILGGNYKMRSWCDKPAFHCTVLQRYVIMLPAFYVQSTEDCKTCRIQNIVYAKPIYTTVYVR